MSENVAESSWMVGRPSVMIVAPAGPEHVDAARVKKLDSGKTDRLQLEISAAQELSTKTVHDSVHEELGYYK
jgi:hypothetical protein